MKHITHNRVGVLALLLSSSAAIAQLLDPMMTSKGVTEVWKSYGLVGLLVTALLMLLGIIGYGVQRYSKMLERTVQALCAISNSHRELIDAIRGMPCIVARQDRHKTPDPFDNFKPLDPSIDTPVK